MIVKTKPVPIYRLLPPAESKAILLQYIAAILKPTTEKKAND